jgi:polyphosphate kinase
MNSLTDVDIIRALYEASRAGVRIRLNVRGICTLRSGVNGLSDRISVVSIVGRHLEHARIAVFHNGDDQEVYLSSADWMTRNLDKRVELMFPVDDRQCAAKVVGALDSMLRDTAKGRQLGPSGEWRLPSSSAEPSFDAQRFFQEQAERHRAPDKGTMFEKL